MLKAKTLDTLKTTLGTDGEENNSQRDDAIMAVLPEPYTKDHITEIQLFTGNGRENLAVQLAEVPVSVTRTVRGTVNCHRALGSMADWECEHRFRNYNQALVNGMIVSVRTLDLDEAQVEAMVTVVQDDIVNARMVSIGNTDSGFFLNARGFDIPGLTARFDRNLNLTEKEFRDR